MKKYLIVLFVVMLIVLSGCSFLRNYEDIYENFEEHLEENADIYLERINLLNHVTNEALPGIVRIKKVSSNQVSNAYGSGLIFDEDPFYYYVLTNHHIVYDKKIEESVYTVYDYKNNSYNATYLAGSNLFDLAVLKIQKKTEDLHVFYFADNNPTEETHLITMGYPESQLNTIHMGDVLSYGIVTIEVDEEIIDVNFDVIYAEIPVKSGSSGSAAINDRFELIGIIYAGNFPENESIADFAFIIPIEQVKLFLTQNEFEYHEVTS